MKMALCCPRGTNGITGSKGVFIQQYIKYSTLNNSLVIDSPITVIKDST